MANKIWYANIYRNDQPKGCESPIYIGNAYRSEYQAKELICKEFNYLKTISFEIDIHE